MAGHICSQVLNNGIQSVHNIFIHSHVGALINKLGIGALGLAGFPRQLRSRQGIAAGLDVYRVGPHTVPPGQPGIIDKFGPAELVGPGEDVVGDIHIVRVGPHVADGDPGVVLIGVAVPICQSGEVQRLEALQGGIEHTVSKGGRITFLGLIPKHPAVEILRQRVPAAVLIHGAGEAPQVDAAPQLCVHLQHRPAGEAEGACVGQRDPAVRVGKGAARPKAEETLSVGEGRVQAGHPGVDGIQSVVCPPGPLVAVLGHGQPQQGQKQGRRREGEQGEPGGSRPVPTPDQRP